MKAARLGSSGPRMSRLTLGTMMFGKLINDKEANRIVSLALENGINAIDTAGTYNNGRSEIMTGKAISGKRDSVILASKVGYPLSGGIEKVDLSAKAVREATEASLRRLGTDYLDILYLHAPDRSTPPGETLEAADKLIKSGKVRYLGISNYPAWEITQLMWCAEKNGFEELSITQNIYNVLSRRAESELVPCAEHFDLEMTVYNPLAGGLLTGKYSGGRLTGRLGWSDMYRNRFLNDDNLAAAGELEKIAQANNMSIIELAYRWCLSKDFVSSMLIGVSSCEQFEKNLAYCSFEGLSEDITACCDRQWEKLRGTAPDYAR